MANKDLMIQYLTRNGKNKSWDELAKLFAFRDGEKARSAWLNYRRKKGLVSPIPIETPAEAAAYITELEDRIVSFEEDIKNGKAQIQADTKQEVKSIDDLCRVCKIDTAKWEVVKYTQAATGSRFSVKAWLEPKNYKGVIAFQDSFVDFLKDYKPIVKEVKALTRPAESKKRACLVINKQDAHLNKFDVEGENDIDQRLADIENATEAVINRALSGRILERIVYVIGSDQFNSEWTSLTTKGTPQQNIGSFHDAFERICDHEVAIINMLKESADVVEVVFLSGNHDEYVGWHMVKWLQAFYKGSDDVDIDSDPAYRKYVSYGSSAMMFNHGDALKPEKLAGIFPMEYSEDWSAHDYYYIFTGDKHHTLSKDINGIQFHQIPALSTAKSQWDQKNGYTVDLPGLTAFVVTQHDGISDILKEVL